MTIYLLIFGMVFILSILNIVIEKQKLKYIYFSIMIFLVFFVGLRKNLGGSDYFVYKGYFNAVPIPKNLLNFEYYIKYEFLYKVLNSIIKIFTTEYFVVTFLIALFTITILFILNYKLCEYPFFTLLYYLYKTFFYTNFVAMRQSIAMVIFFISIKYIIDKNFKKYMILIFIAMLFHTSAIILMPLYLLSKVDLRKIKIVNCIVVIILLKILSKPILIILHRTVVFIGVNSSITNKVLDVINGTGITFINLHIVEAIIYMIIFYSLRKVSGNKNKIYYSLFIVYFITLIIFSNYEIFIRISMYFYMPLMVLFSEKVNQIKKYKLKILFIYILGLIFMIGYIKYLLMFDNGGLMPYRNILF